MLVYAIPRNAFYHYGELRQPRYGPRATFLVTPSAVPSVAASGIPNATGRDGSAAVTARALLGKDNTTIELTTGKLDSSATPPGSFAYVQFRPLAPSGAALFTPYLRHLATPTGYYSFT